MRKRKGMFLLLLLPVLFLAVLSVNGTASAEIIDSDIACDPYNNRYLMVYDKNNCFQCPSDIFGQFVNPDGTLQGSEFVISNAVSFKFEPTIAYDSINRRFLIVWLDTRYGDDDIYGQLVNEDGSLYGTASDVNFVISDASLMQYLPQVAFDSVNERFLVVWMDYRSNDIEIRHDIYGQLVNVDGTLYGTASDVNFVIADAYNSQSHPSLDYDSANQRFLVAWMDYRICLGGTDTDIYGQLVNADGTLYDQNNDGTGDTNDNFVISSASRFQNPPAVACDSANQRCLVAWSDSRDSGSGIYGQLVNADGTLYGPSHDVNFVISNFATSQGYASLAYDSTNQRFLALWADGRNWATSYDDIYGQFVNADGTLYCTASDVNLVISQDPESESSTSIAYNPANSTFMVLFEKMEMQTYTTDIGLTLVDSTCPQSALSVTKAGTGNGTVSSTPTGIDCGADCSELYNVGTQVTLAAIADADSVFVGWSGGGCSGTGTCTVTMDADTEVTASFTINSITVAVPNGGESWVRGKTYTISWTYTGNPGSSVKIELYKGGAYKSTIIASTPIGDDGNGSYEWNIHKKERGTDYAIKITSTTDSSYADTSDGYFTILK